MTRLPEPAVEHERPTTEAKQSDPRPDAHRPEGGAQVPDLPPEAEPENEAPGPGTHAAELQRLYNNYIRFFPAGQAFGPAQWKDTPQKKEALQDLLQAAWQYGCRSVIRKTLAAGGLWANDLDNESQSIFDDAFHNLMKDLSRRRSRGEEVLNFAGLAQRICHNRCIDYLRAVHPEKKGEIRLPCAGDYAPPAEEKRGTDRPRFQDPYYRNEDGFVPDEGLFRDTNTNVVRTLEHRMERDWLWQILYCYVRVMLEYDKQPEKVLGLCYGRVLYQMAGRLDPDFGPADDQPRSTSEEDWDSDYKQPKSGASPVWAMRQMRGKTLAGLRDESQEELSRLFGFPLRWGEKFCRALETCRTVEGTGRLLADIPYDTLCTLEQVRRWCNSIHDTLLPRACELILQNSELVDYCAENLPATAKAFLNKGEK